jgi:hypothetical protein
MRKSQPCHLVVHRESLQTLDPELLAALPPAGGNRRVGETDVGLRPTGGRQVLSNPTGWGFKGGADI